MNLMKERPINVAIIPARGGSKGIPRKNLRPLLGRPLLEYTLYTANLSQELHSFYVSSEDKEILEYCRKLGVKTIERPLELALDHTPTLPVIQHGIEEIEKGLRKKVDNIVVLQATTPLKNETDIDGVIRLLIKQASDSAVSVCEILHGHPLKSKKIVKDQLVSFFGLENEGLPRQQLEPAYMRNGAVYAFTRKVLFEEGSLYGTTCAPYIMPPERSFDIDTELDFLIVQSLLENPSWRAKWGLKLYDK